MDVSRLANQVAIDVNPFLCTSGMAGVMNFGRFVACEHIAAFCERHKKPTVFCPDHEDSSAFCKMQDLKKKHELI